jgi:hypothetical protein
VAAGCMSLLVMERCDQSVWDGIMPHDSLLSGACHAAPTMRESVLFRTASIGCLCVCSSSLLHHLRVGWRALVGVWFACRGATL